MSAPFGNKNAIGKHNSENFHKLSVELVQKAEGYVQWCEDNPLDTDEIIKDGVIVDFKKRLRLPSIQGLCVYLKVSHRTLGRWLAAASGEENNHNYNVELCKGIDEVVALIETWQAATTIEQAMVKNYDSAFSRLLMAQHGWRDKTDVTTDGDKVQNTSVVLTNPAINKKISELDKAMKDILSKNL
jgi:hypothetical protein